MRNGTFFLYKDHRPAYLFGSPESQCQHVLLPIVSLPLTQHFVHYSYEKSVADSGFGQGGRRKFLGEYIQHWCSDVSDKPKELKKYRETSYPDVNDCHCTFPKV